MNKISIGIVADDFTGASDAASFLVKEGMKTFLYSGVPETRLESKEENIAIVIALKTRTEETSKAVNETLNAINWLKTNGADQLYIKYCSTFDSTKKGNIGPIIDSVLEKYKLKYTIIAPALPVNGRIVKNGNLIVNGVPLHKTHMKHHPLTPMWDSDISKLMGDQGKYPCQKVSGEMLGLNNEDIINMITEFGRDKEHFYVIPDFYEEQHAGRIIELFGELPLLTGGSGLMTELGRKYQRNKSLSYSLVNSSTNGKAIILAGSCSAATLEQIEEFKKANRKYIKIDPIKLAEGSQTKEDILKSIETINEDAILVYSSDTPENVKSAQQLGNEAVSGMLESTMAYLAKMAVERGINRIIVAGGETSGSVTKALDYSSYQIGESIDPGVPIMVPLKNNKVRLVLKSGNFGTKKFFLKAIHLTKENQND